jgi:hypothetical protein
VAGQQVEATIRAEPEGLAAAMEDIEYHDSCGEPTMGSKPC